MNQENNSKTLLECKKDPYLKFRYSRGIGDLIACLLHSKLFGWFTKLITGKSKPCSVCSQRANALNTLFPIPFWRMFFNDAILMTKSLKLELEKCGYKVDLTEDQLGVSSFKVKNEEITKTEEPEKESNSYTLLTSGETILGDFLIKTEIYKKD